MKPGRRYLCTFASDLLVVVLTSLGNVGTARVWCPRRSCRNLVIVFAGAWPGVTLGVAEHDEIFKRE